MRTIGAARIRRALEGIHQWNRSDLIRIAMRRALELCSNRPMHGARVCHSITSDRD
jgi:hypothetical protein